MPHWGDSEGRTRAPEDTPDERNRPDVLPPLGTRLGRYILLHPLGEGGMGVVYAARDPVLDRKVALKLVRASGRRAQTRRARLLREAQALARLNHPNVVEVLDAGVVDARDWNPDADPPERVWIAMELVPADTLDVWQGKHRPTWRQILDTFAAAGRGLHAAHLAGLVHRDFKPENVLVGSDGRVRVTDFGLARPPPRGAEPEGDDADAEPTASRSDMLHVRLTRTGASIGTPAYMSPEQHRREAVDARSDQFNFCVGLYEALYRRPPFQGRDVPELARAVQAGNVRPPPPKCPVPARVFRVLRRGLAASADDRWPSVEALLFALRRAVRPRARVALALVGGTLAGALAWLAWPVSPQAGCDSDRAPLEASWNDARAAELADKLGASRLPYAAETWTRVRPRLDAYVASWTDAYHTACHGERVTPELRDQRMVCLAEARARFEAVLESIERVDRPAIREAVQRVTALSGVDRCLDDARLQSEPALPSEPSTRARVAALRDRLARLGADRAVRDDARLLVRAREAVAEAEHLGWAPLHGLALYQLGVVQQGAARHDDAAASLEQAYFVASEAGDPRTAARAALHLAHLLGATRSDLRAGLSWVGHARAAIGSLEDALDLEARLANTLGEIHYRHGRYDEAFEHHSRAVELDERLGGADSVDVAMGMHNLGNVVFKRGDPEAAAAHYARALEIREHALGPAHPSVGASLSNLGSMERLLGRGAEAQAHLERALVVMESALGPEHPDVGNPLNSLFLVHSDAGHWDQARRYIERALAIWAATHGEDHPNVAIGRSNLGMLLLRLGQPNEALEQLERSVAILETVVGPEHPNLAFPLATLGRAWLDLDEPERARAVLVRARPLRVGQGEGAPGVAIVDARIAEADVRLGHDRAGALVRGRAALERLREAGTPWQEDAAEVAAWITRVDDEPPAAR